MSGRPKQRVYEYSKDGKFLGTYESQAEARGKYYPNDIGKRPLFEYDDYHILNNENVLCRERLGRTGIKRLYKRLNNQFITDETEPIKVINLDNEVIARFKNIRIAYRITNVPYGTIHSQLNSKKKVDPYFTKEGLLFRYE